MPLSMPEKMCGSGVSVKEQSREEGKEDGEKEREGKSESKEKAQW